MQLNRLTAGLKARVLVKCEFFNPLGSVKDRIGLAIITAAQRDGQLRPGTTIIEPTSGNTGIALAFIAAARGYRVILTMPDSMSRERRTLFAMLGAGLVLTPAAEGAKGAMDRARELQREIPNSWIPNQFENPANPRMHRETTAPEILDDTDGRVDVFVSAVGTGGTLSGVGEVLKSQNPSVRCVAVEPAKAPAISLTLAGLPLVRERHGIQGIGIGFIPGNLNLALVDEVVTVNDEDAIATSRELAKKEGLLVGISTGANVFAALQVARRPENAGRVIVTVACSTGERYLSTVLAEQARQLVSSEVLPEKVQ